jgi:MFS superfamily sulfate permease-like transporter
MISEVARSSSNVSNGAKTRWANFFHGFFILSFVLIASHWIELIPNTALAAMLITVGVKLAHPKEFIHIFQIGKEQLAVFLVTIFLAV